MSSSPILGVEERADHEAGHLAAALITADQYGFVCLPQFATVETRVHSGGSTGFRWVDEKTREWVKQEDLPFQYAACYIYAGFAAQWAGLDARLQHDLSDDEITRLRRLADDDFSQVERMKSYSPDEGKSALNEAFKFVKEHRSIITGLSFYLQENVSMFGDESKVIYRLLGTQMNDEEGERTRQHLAHYRNSRRTLAPPEEWSHGETKEHPAGQFYEGYGSWSKREMSSPV